MKAEKTFTSMVFKTFRNFVYGFLAYQKILRKLIPDHFQLLGSPDKQFNYLKLLLVDVSVR